MCVLLICFGGLLFCDFYFIKCFKPDLNPFFSVKILLFRLTWTIFLVTANLCIQLDSVGFLNATFG